MSRKPRPLRVPGLNSCMCGCGETTKSRFTVGHDSRMKSRLFKAAREGDLEAHARIIELGWLHLYDKSQPAPPRPEPKAPRVKVEPVEGETLDEARAKDLVDTYMRARAIGRRLQTLGRYGVSAGERRIPVQINAQWCTDMESMSDQEIEAYVVPILVG